MSETSIQPEVKRRTSNFIVLDTLDNEGAPDRYAAASSKRDDGVKAEDMVVLVDGTVLTRAFKVTEDGADAGSQYRAII